jgi:cell division protein FtsL
MWRVINIVLALAILVSALGVVYATHETRMHYVQLQALNRQRDNLDVEWGRLQLEQSTWATQGRIEKVAKDKLNMHSIDYSKVVIFKP